MDSSIVATNILSLSRFKARASEVLNTMNRDGHPVVITQNGEAAAVLLTPEEYDRLAYRASFIAAVDQGYAESEAGRVIEGETIAADLQRRYGRR